MRLTIGMASYNNFTEVWFTVQALRLHQDLTDVEILIIDNYGDVNIKNFVDGWASPQVRFVEYKESTGTAAAKNRVFAEAKGDWVLCIDSHVMLRQGTIARLIEWTRENPDSMDLFQGPLIYDNLVSGADSFSTEWSGGMWGKWNNIHTDRTLDPYEIPMMGMGLFLCRRDAWLGFNNDFRGFGGEEGYIHEKYRKYGHKVICLPWLEWLHHFRPQGSVPYIVSHEDKIRNYVIGFTELGLSLDPLIEHFGKEGVMRYVTKTSDEIYNLAVNEQSDINEHLPVIASLSREKIVTEFGVRSGTSTTAWIYGKPKKLTSYDINPCPRESELLEMAKNLNVDFSLLIGNSLCIDIDKTDILFIDTLHTGDQLYAELTKHSDNVDEAIVLHDTVTFGEVGEDGSSGLNHAVNRFLSEHSEWSIDRVYSNNNGLTILRRK